MVSPEHPIASRRANDAPALAHFPEIPKSEDVIRRGWHFWNLHTRTGYLPDQSLTATKVTAALDRSIEERGTPESITVDNSSEFASSLRDQWTRHSGRHKSRLHPPWQAG